jgi:D-alanyl-D-alanine carboxypeptidase
MNYNYDNETPRHDRPSAHRTQRIRRQNQTLMAIAVTFVLLLLVFAILLSITAISSIGENNPPTNDTPSGEQPDNTPPAGDGDQVPDNDPPADDAYTITLSADRIHEGELILINRSHVYPFPSINLVNVYNNQVIAKTYGQYMQVANTSLWMEQTAYRQMDKLLAAFGDPSVMMTSAHRTYEQQQALGSLTKPGYSDSHSGLSCELRGQSGSTPLPLTNEKYTWLYENCYKYGFVVRYPADKVAQTGVEDYTNYFRYVGYAHAYVMKTNNLCLEEYISYVKSYTFGDRTLKVITDDGSNYEIYYVAATGAQTQVPVPKDNNNYSISGDNEGGFIVTVKVS